MINLKDVAQTFANIHNTMNDLEIKGGSNARIIIYVQETCKQMIDQIKTELDNRHPVPVVNLEEVRKESTENDNPGSTEQH